MIMESQIEYALMSGAAYFSTRADVNKFPIPNDWNELERVTKACN